MKESWVLGFIEITRGKYRMLSVVVFFLYLYVFVVCLTTLLGLLTGLTFFVLRFLFKYITLGFGVIIILLWVMLILL